MLASDTNNMWLQYAWQAMQAGGVISYGVPAATFLISFVVDLNIMERLSLIMKWVVLGGLIAHLFFVTVFSYFISAGALYTSSIHSSVAEIWITFAVYVVAQLGFAALLLYFAKDTLMYLIAGELETICQKYGAFCTQYGILDPAPAGDDFEESDGQNLSTTPWTW